MKFIFMLFDIGILWLIVKILKHLGCKPALVIVYGWSPLVLKEFPNSGHYDPVVIFFVLLAIVFYLRRKKMFFVCSLALSALSKFFTVVFLPIFARCLNWKHFLVFGGVVGLFYLPFIVMGHTGKGVLTGFLIYHQNWNYNASVFALIYAVFQAFAPHMVESLVWVKLIAGSIYFFVLACLLKDRPIDDRSLMHQCFVALAALFILNPVGDPWYFCWLVPFLCVFPYRAWILLSGLLALSYLNFQPDILKGWFLNIPVLNWIIYVPFFLYWLFERSYQRRRFI